MRLALGALVVCCVSANGHAQQLDLAPLLGSSYRFIEASSAFGQELPGFDFGARLSAVPGSFEFGCGVIHDLCPLKATFSGSPVVVEKSLTIRTWLIQIQAGHSLKPRKEKNNVVILWGIDLSVPYRTDVTSRFADGTEREIKDAEVEYGLGFGPTFGGRFYTKWGEHSSFFAELKASIVSVQDHQDYSSHFGQGDHENLPDHHASLMLLVGVIFHYPAAKLMEE